jgi:hypothetical protein
MYIVIYFTFINILYFVKYIVLFYHRQFYTTILYIFSRYDLVNRPIDGWIFGNFEVPENQKLSVNFTAVTSETFLAYPGVVGLDDISFTTGKCPVSQGKRCMLL